MKNLQDPKLTNQERQEIVRQSIDKDYQKAVKHHQMKDPSAFCFHSYWTVTRNDVSSFNQGANALDTWFDFHSDVLEAIDPALDLVLLEGERVEVGEWDKTYNRWCSNPYQRVLIINLNAKFHGFYPESEGMMLGIYSRTDGQEWRYPSSWNEDGSPKKPCCIGLLDIPLQLLDSFEQKRTFQDLWNLSSFYNETRNRLINGQKRQQMVRAKRKSYKHSQRNLKSFKQSFKGGFES